MPAASLTSRSRRRCAATCCDTKAATSSLPSTSHTPSQARTRNSSFGARARVMTSGTAITCSLECHTRVESERVVRPYTCGYAPLARARYTKVHGQSIQSIPTPPPIHIPTICSSADFSLLALYAKSPNARVMARESCVSGLGCTRQMRVTAPLYVRVYVCFLIDEGGLNE